MEAPLLAALLASVPLTLLAAVTGLRAPLGVLAVYAAVIPFGSSVQLPLPLPSPFDTLSTLVGLLAVVSVGINVLLSRRHPSRILLPVPLWVLFVGLAGTSVIWSLNPSATFREFVVLVSLVALFAVTAFVDVSARDVSRVEAAIVLGGALTGAYALYQLLTGTLPMSGADIPRFGTTGGGGEAGDPNITAAALVLPFSVALGHALRRGQPARRPLYAAAVALIAVGILLTLSRGGFVGVLVVLAVFAAIERRRAVVATLLVLPVSLLGVGWLLLPEAVSQRVAQQDSTGRTDIWKIGLEACTDYCWRGSGLGTFPDVHEDALLNDAGARGNRLRFEAHTIWLGTAVELGVLGLAVLVLALGSALRDLLRLPRQVRGPPLAAFVALLITNSFVSNLGFKYFWMVLVYAMLMTLAHGRVDLRLPPAARVWRVTDDQEVLHA